MPGHQHRTPYWYRHSYHQPASLHFLAPPDLRAPPDLLLQPRGQIKENASARFIRQKSSRERPRPSSISDLHYSVESSPASSVPSKSSVSSTDTSWRPSTDSGRQTESDSSCELTQELTRGLARGSKRELTHTELTRDLNLATISGVSLPSLPTGINSLAILDQSCSSLPSQSNASSGSSQEQDSGFHESSGQIPVWKRNGKFVSFFRSFMGNKPQKEKKQAAKAPVFGTELAKLLSDTGDEVPQVVRICTQFIEEHGVVNGIYRASGISSNIQRIKNLFNDQRVPNLSGDSSLLHDIHCVSSVLKLYFRALPTPLVTYDLYPHLVLASKLAEGKRGEKFREILHRLPSSHYRTIDFLMRHLHQMSLHSDRTGMTSKNLAIVWSPNILRCDVSELDTQDALQDVGLQAVITEFLIRCSSIVFAPNNPPPPVQMAPSHCMHCCCHCAHSAPTNNNNNISHSNSSHNNNGSQNNNNGARSSVTSQHSNLGGSQAPQTSGQHQGAGQPQTVTFAISNSDNSGLKPVLKQSIDNTTGQQHHQQQQQQQNSQQVQHVEEKPASKKVELRVNKNPLRPRPRSVAVPNVEAVRADEALHAEEVRLVSLPGRQTAELVQVKERGVEVKGVTFHSVVERERGRASRPWRNIFPGSRSRSGTQREVNIDEAVLMPENKPINFRPRPRSEVNLSYSVQDSTMLLTPLKNNEFQVTTTNQFSYLPYQQSLLAYNKQQPFTRSNKLRTAVIKREQKNVGPRPKSVDFEVLQSVENICRAQPLAYSAGVVVQGTRASQRRGARL